MWGRTIGALYAGTSRGLIQRMSTSSVSHGRDANAEPSMYADRKTDSQTRKSDVNRRSSKSLASGVPQHTFSQGSSSTYAISMHGGWHNCSTNDMLARGVIGRTIRKSVKIGIVFCCF